MEFEWDSAKAQRNQRKHRVTFDQATAVFDDSAALIELDETTDEERWNAIGLAKDKILFVVYVERNASTYRIISARRADKDEQDRYYRQALPQR